MSILHKIFTFFFILNYIPKIIKSQSVEYKCGELSKNLKVGDEVILCIHILKENKKVAMPIKVDEYSMVSFNHIFEIYDKLNNKNEAQFIAQIGDTLTINPTVRLYLYYYNNSYIIMNLNVLI
jgi:hypothetical protein